jgi:glycosyltransferase involved in cell wall biosynthesis
MTDDTGVLVPPGDPPALADALVELLGDEPRRARIGASGRRLAIERYSWDTIAARLEQIYEEVA